MQSTLRYVLRFSCHPFGAWLFPTNCLLYVSRRRKLSGKKVGEGGGMIHEESREKSFAICLSFAEDDSIGEKSAVR